MTELEQQELCRALAVFIQEQVDRAVEQRLKDFAYKGVYENGSRYVRGNFVTKGGSVWACLQSTSQVPGESSDWQLAVKHGADGSATPTESPTAPRTTDRMMDRYATGLFMLFALTAFMLMISFLVKP